MKGYYLDNYKLNNNIGSFDFQYIFEAPSHKQNVI